jgi:glycosyltransferase involved in cell wall biosynthesis
MKDLERRRRPRVLFVCMTESVHSVRWLRQVAPLGFERHVFPASGLGLHPDLSDVTVHYLLAAPPPGRRLRCEPMVWPFEAGAWRVNRWRRDGLLSREYRTPSWRADHLAATLRRLKPDLVHTLETQHAGYLALEARERLGGWFPPWLHTPWGSDLFLFGRLAAHEPRLRKVLSAVDAYQPKSCRDADLARHYGFQGTMFPVIPGNGGFDLAELDTWRSPIPPSQRRLIHVKGYSGWAGRALFALRALRDMKARLHGFRIRVTSAAPEVILAAELLRREHGLDLEIVPAVAHEVIMRLQGDSRVSLGASISDGVPNSMLEAMAMGAFPIESQGSCANEWFEDGRTGLLVDPEDTGAIGRALTRALDDDRLVDAAAEANRRVIAERMDARIIHGLAGDMYHRLLRSGPGTEDQPQGGNRA